MFVIPAVVWIGGLKDACVEPVALCALLQVNDISQLGNPIEVAQLILPRGSTLLATATAQVPVPSKQTPVGVVELPPQTYYRCLRSSLIHTQAARAATQTATQHAGIGSCCS